MAELLVYPHLQPIPGTRTQHFSGFIFLGCFFAEAIQVLIG
jgi:hypothetical protein